MYILFVDINLTVQCYIVVYFCDKILKVSIYFEGIHTNIPQDGVWMKGIRKARELAIRKDLWREYSQLCPV